jgi:hypothetical protein
MAVQWKGVLVPKPGVAFIIVLGTTERISTGSNPSNMAIATVSDIFSDRSFMKGKAAFLILFPILVKSLNNKNLYPIEYLPRFSFC